MAHGRGWKGPTAQRRSQIADLRAHQKSKISEDGGRHKHFAGGVFASAAIEGQRVPARAAERAGPSRQAESEARSEGPASEASGTTEVQPAQRSEQDRLRVPPSRAVGGFPFTNPQFLSRITMARRRYRVAHWAFQTAKPPILGPGAEIIGSIESLDGIGMGVRIEGLRA